MGVQQRGCKHVDAESGRRHAGQQRPVHRLGHAHARCHASHAINPDITSNAAPFTKAARISMRT